MCCKINYEYDLIFRVIMKLFLMAGLLINSFKSKSVARQGENDIEEYKPHLLQGEIYSKLGFPYLSSHKGS